MQFHNIKIFHQSNSPHSSAEEAERHLGRECRHARDEGGEPADDEGEEGEHSATAALAALPPTAGHRRGPAAFSAAVWHQRSEWRLIFFVIGGEKKG